MEFQDKKDHLPSIWSGNKITLLDTLKVKIGEEIIENLDLSIEIDKEKVVEIWEKSYYKVKIWNKQWWLEVWKEITEKEFIYDRVGINILEKRGKHYYFADIWNKQGWLELWKENKENIIYNNVGLIVKKGERFFYFVNIWDKEAWVELWKENKEEIYDSVDSIEERDWKLIYMAKIGEKQELIEL